jgi:hypothetical protein
MARIRPETATHFIFLSQPANETGDPDYPRKAKYAANIQAGDVTMTVKQANRIMVTIASGHCIPIPLARCLCSNLSNVIDAKETHQTSIGTEAGRSRTNRYGEGTSACAKSASRPRRFGLSTAAGIRAAPG